MTDLAKLNFQTVDRNRTKDPALARRDKLVAGLREQKLVLVAQLKGEDHRVEKQRWMNNELGERALVKTLRRVRPWFFEQDGGWYVQCRYGARILAVDGENNAVFVNSLEQVKTVLEVFEAAAQKGDLDEAISTAVRRPLKSKPAPADAAKKARGTLRLASPPR